MSCARYFDKLLRSGLCLPAQTVTHPRGSAAVKAAKISVLTEYVKAET
jgi:hypothetical protein